MSCARRQQQETPTLGHLLKDARRPEYRVGGGAAVVPPRYRTIRRRPISVAPSSPARGGRAVEPAWWTFARCFQRIEFFFLATVDDADDDDKLSALRADTVRERLRKLRGNEIGEMVTAQ